jgi:hypothetical protein
MTTAEELLQRQDDVMDLQLRQQVRGLQAYVQLACPRLGQGHRCAAVRCCSQYLRDVYGWLHRKCQHWWCQQPQREQGVVCRSFYDCGPCTPQRVPAGRSCSE